MNRINYFTNNVLVFSMLLCLLLPIGVFAQSDVPQGPQHFEAAWKDGDACTGKLKIAIFLGNVESTNDYAKVMYVKYKVSGSTSWTTAMTVGNDDANIAQDFSYTYDDLQAMYFDVSNGTGPTSSSSVTWSKGSQDNGSGTNRKDNIYATFEWTPPADLLGKTFDMCYSGTFRDDDGKDVSTSDGSIMRTMVGVMVPSPISVTSSVSETTMTVSWTNPTMPCSATNWWIEVDGVNVGQVTSKTKTVSYGSTSSAKVVLKWKFGAATLSSVESTTSGSSGQAIKAPQNLKAAMSTCGQVDLSWTPDYVADTYIVSRKDGSAGTYADITTIASTAAMSYNDTKITNGTTYYYKVTAKKGSQTQISTEVSIGSMGDAVAPASFTALYDADDEEVKLSWTYTGQYVDNFIVKRGDDIIADALKGTDRSFQDPNASPCTDYKYYVQAKTGCNASSPVPAEVSVPGGAIGKVTLTASDGEFPNYVQLSWNQVENTGRYRISRDGMQLASIDDPGATSYLDMDAVPGDYYTYRIDALSNCELDSTVVSSEDLGYILPNGKITGHVKTLAGNFVKDVEVLLFPDDGSKFGSSVKFVGGLANTSAKVTLRDDDNGFTIETWAKKISPTDEGVLFRDANGKLVFGFRNRQLQLFVNAQQVLAIPDPAANNEWHHYRLEYRYDQFSVYLDQTFLAKTTVADFSLADYMNIAGSITVVGVPEKGYATSLQPFSLTNYDMSTKPFSVQAAVKPTDLTSNVMMLGNENGYAELYVQSGKYMMQMYANNQQYAYDMRGGNDNIGTLDKFSGTIWDNSNPNIKGSYNGGYGLLFDGVDDRVSLAGGNNDFKLERDKPLSVEAWIRPTASSTSVSYIFAAYSGSAPTSQFGISLYMKSGKLYSDVAYYNNNVREVLTVTGSNITLNQWSQVAMTVQFVKGSGSNYTLTSILYVNGVEAARQTKTSTTFSFDKNSSTGSIGYMFKGVIDNVRYWYGRNLTSTEISTVYNNPLAVPRTSELKAEYDFGQNILKVAPITGASINKSKWQYITFSCGNGNYTFKVTTQGTTSPTYTKTLTGSIPKGFKFGENKIAVGTGNEKVDEVRIWNTSSVSTNYIGEAQLIGSESGLMGYYPMSNFLTVNRSSMISSYVPSSLVATSVLSDDEATLKTLSMYNFASFKGWVSGFRIWDTGKATSSPQSLIAGAVTDLLCDFVFESSNFNGNSVANTVTNGFSLILSGLYEQSQETPNYAMSVRTDLSGNYVLDKVNYGGALGRTFKIIPYKAGHKFDPDNKTRTLDPTQTIIDGVDFTDLSTQPVSGTIMYSNTLCYEQNKEVLIDNESSAPPAKSNDNGFWDMSVEMDAHVFSVRQDTIIPEYVSKTVYFDGTTKSLNLGKVDFNNKNFTIEFYTKRYDANSIGGVFALGNLSAGFSSTSRFNVYVDGKSVLYMTTTPSDLSWVQWSISYDVVQKKLLFYQNAQLVGSYYPKTLNVSGDVFVGKANAVFFKGYVDEVRLWARTLNNEALTNQYKKVLTGKEDSLVSYYNFDAIEENIAKNLSVAAAGQGVTVTGFTVAEGALAKKPLFYSYSPVNGKYNPKDGVYKLFIDDPMVSLDFENTSTYELKIGIRGNCNYSIGLSDVQITSTPACFDTLLVGIDKDLSIKLPPLTYNVKVMPQDRSKQIDPKMISMERGDTAVVFEYRTPLQVEVKPSWQSQQICQGKVVMDQFVRDSVYFEVFEDYDGQRCPVEGGMIVLYDDIGNKKNDPDTLFLSKGSKGKTRHVTAGILPNIAAGGLHPYQRKIDCYAIDTLERVATAEHWAYIRGLRPRPSTFTSRMPSSPFLILRDPPGDMSYSYFEKSESHSFTMGNMEMNDESFGMNLHVSLLPKFTMQTGAPGATTELENTPIAQSDQGFNLSSSYTSNKEVTFTMTTTERFQTGDGDGLMGEDADVFIGGALNMIFAPADELYFENCTPKIKVGIAASPDTISTFFIYTGAHIKNKVIPYLEFLKNDTIQKLTLRGASAIQIKSVTDEYNADITSWNNMLDYNHMLKEGAVFKRNISFTHGATYETFETVDTTSTLSIETSSTTSGEFMQALGFYVNDAGAEVQFTESVSATIGQSTTDEFTNSVTVGYFLGDDDPGDFFSVNVYHDPVYRTPVFKTLAGESMCPWEEQTQAREGVEFIISSSSTQNNVDADGVAVFEIGLRNTSHSQDPETVYLSVDNKSNPDGAVISVNGIVMGAYPIPVDLEPNINVPLTVTVARGPLAYDYKNIKLTVQGCETGERDGHRLSDTVPINVFFKRPCVSGLTVMDPKPNWVFNMQTQTINHDTLHVFFTAPDLKNIVSNPQTDLFRFEYAPITSNEPLTVLGGDVKVKDIKLFGQQGKEYATIPIYVGNLDDNKYQIRMTAMCIDGRRSSSDWVAGSMFRTAPEVLGTPEPSDGVLDANDKIEIGFDKPIVGAALRPHNVKLYGKLATVTSKPVSMSFDGLNDHAVLFDDTTSINFYQIGTNHNFSVEFWIKAPTTGWKGKPAIITNKAWDSPYNKGWAAYGQTDGVSVGFNMSDGKQIVDLDAGLIADNKWHHVGVIVDKTCCAIVYVDLVEKDRASVVGLGDISSRMPMVLSNDATRSHPDYFRGSLDEVRYWARPITRGELVRQWKVPLLGNEDSLVACWRLDSKGAAEGKFFDITGNYPQGTMYGSQWDEFSAAPIDYSSIVEELPVSFSSFDNKVILIPNIEKRFVEDVELTARLNKIPDYYGNTTGQIEWSFYVNQNIVNWETPYKNVVKFTDSTYSFKVKLLNAASSVEPFWLINLPEWLTADVTEGSIPGFGSQEITFTVSKAIGNGDYKGTLYAETKGGWEPLNVGVRVICPMPKESVNPANFEYSMNIVANVMIDTAQSRDVLDVVRAYVGEELRGVGHIEYVKAVNDYRLFMTIYSNTTDAEQFTFRIWDASNCSDYLGTKETISFADNNLLGTPETPVLIYVSGAVEKTYNLKRGWNWISFNVNPEASDEPKPFSIKNFMYGTFSSVDVIKSQTQFAQYVKPNWTGTLTNISNAQGYLMYSANPTTMKVSGYQIPSYTPMELKAGWNWIGFPPNTYIKLKDALSSIQYSAQDGDIIKSQDEFAVFSSTKGWVGNLEYLAPQRAYMIKLSQDGILYNSSNKSTTVMNLAYSADATNEALQHNITVDNWYKRTTEQTTWSVDAHAFGYSMNVAGAIKLNDKNLNEGNHIVAAFVNGECRGIAMPVQSGNDWLYYVTIYGNNNNEKVYFKAWLADRDTIVFASNVMDFASDAVVGNPATPYNFNFTVQNATPVMPDINRAALYELNQNTPNPFNNNTLINFALPEDTQIKLAVYDATGRLVRVLASGFHRAGRYNVPWNGLNFKGEDVPSGMYYYRLESPATLLTRQMSVVR